MLATLVHLLQIVRIGSGSFLTNVHLKTAYISTNGFLHFQHLLKKMRLIYHQQLTFCLYQLTFCLYQLTFTANDLLLPTTYVCQELTFVANNLVLQFSHCIPEDEMKKTVKTALMLIIIILWAFFQKYLSMSFLIPSLYVTVEDTMVKETLWVRSLIQTETRCFTLPAGTSLSVRIIYHFL